MLAAALAITTSFLSLSGGDLYENKDRTPTITRIAGTASVVAAALPAIALGYEIFAPRRNVPLGATPHHKPSRIHNEGYTYTRTTGSGARAPRSWNGALYAMAMCAAAGMAGAGLVDSGSGQDDSTAPGHPSDDTDRENDAIDNSLGGGTGSAGWSICSCAFLHYLMVVLDSIFRRSEPLVRRRAKRSGRFRHGPG